MADGEATYDRFYLIRNDPFPDKLTVDVPQSRECCNELMLHFLADTEDNDPLRNDVVGPIWCLPAIATGATLTLIRNGEDVANLTTGELIPSGDPVVMGDLLDFGDFINIDGRALVGYQLKFQNVLDQFGPGKYKIMIEITTAIPGISGTYYSPDYCLMPYSAGLANGTVRIEYYRSGIMGKADDDTERIDYGDLNWYSSLRLPGWFGFPQPKTDRKNVEYNNGDRKYVTQTNEPEYELQLKQVPFYVHQMMYVDVNMADEILMTDYNSRNEYTWVKKRVFEAGYEIDRSTKMQSKLSGATGKYNQTQNNLRKQRQ